MALGNHDDRAPFFWKNQDTTYYSFRQGNDVFIILDANPGGWNIEGDQLAFLEQTLSDAVAARNIFVFSHQLIWWAPDNQFACIFPNSTQGRRKKSNFYTDVLPLFEKTGAEIFFFAGDIGAFPDHLPVYAHRDNMHFIASGMGGGNGTYVVVHVDDTVTLEIKWLADQSRDNSSDPQNYQIDCRAN